MPPCSWRASAISCAQFAKPRRTFVGGLVSVIVAGRALACCNEINVGFNERQDMTRISNYFESIVCGCGFALLTYFGSSSVAAEDSDRSLAGSVIAAALFGAYIGYLVKCFRQGKQDAESEMSRKHPS